MIGYSTQPHGGDSCLMHWLSQQRNTFVDDLGRAAAGLQTAASPMTSMTGRDQAIRLVRAGNYRTALERFNESLAEEPRRLSNVHR